MNRVYFYFNSTFFRVRTRSLRVSSSFQPVSLMMKVTHKETYLDLFVFLLIGGGREEEKERNYKKNFQNGVKKRLISVS